MKLEVYTLNAAPKSYNGLSLIKVPTTSGERGILTGHMEFAGELSKGTLQFVDKSHKKHDVAVEQGYVSFDNNVCKAFLFEEIK